MFGKPSVTVRYGPMRSPIEQEIIDGVCYWGPIGNRWYRLIDKVSQDVLGHYRFELGANRSLDRWNAVINSTSSRASFPTESEAREFIEQFAAKYYDGLKAALVTWA